MKWIARSILFLMILAAVLLMAFGPRPNAKIPPGRIVITYWEKWGGDQAAAMKRIVDSFNDTVGAQQGIYVQYLSLTNVDRKTLTATAAGVPPDVAGLWERNVAPFAARRALLPLDKLAQSHGLTKSHYKPVYWEECRYDNHLYALPSTPGVVALHYNKKIFYQNAGRLRAAGLDPTRPPRTIAEFDRYAEALDYRNPRTGRLQRRRLFHHGTRLVHRLHARLVRRTHLRPRDEHVHAADARVHPRLRLDCQLLPPPGPRRHQRFPLIHGRREQPAKCLLHREGRDDPAGPVDGQLHPLPQARHVRGTGTDGP